MKGCCRRLAVVAIGWACLAAGSSPARASCPSPVPLGHLYDSWLACADSAPVPGFAYVLADPAGANSGVADLTCETFDPNRNCFTPASGGAADGRLTIYTDWFNREFIGCPIAQDAPQRIVIVARAGDGGSIVVSLSGADPGFGYLVELAHPVTAAADAILPLSCSDRGGRPRILSVTQLPDGRLASALRFDAPVVHSDCDPGSLGALIGPQTCPDGFRADPSVAGIYSSLQPCSGATDLDASRWTDTGARADPFTGEATVILAPPPAGRCLYVGNTALIGGRESGAIIGLVDLPSQGCTDADADGDGSSGCSGDCDDANAAVHPAAPEICDGIDNNCNLRVDDGPEGLDPDDDGVASACDTCPTVSNPGQEPTACASQIIPVVDLEYSSRGSAILTWTTYREVGVAGFEIVDFNPQRGGRIVNTATIPCQQCVTANGATYSFTVPKRRDGRDFYVGMTMRDGRTFLFGPARVTR